MGLQVEDMTPDQLIEYIQTYYLAYDTRLVAEGFRERAIFHGLQRRYGQADAGRIVQWAFLHHGGEYRDEPITFSKFTKGCAWFTDIMLAELNFAAAAVQS